MTQRTTHEPTQAGNPHQITVQQHVHARALIARFAGKDRHVGVLRKGSSRVERRGPKAACFCASRVWDEHLEHGVFARRIEEAFVRVVDAALSTGSVTSHEAVTEYFSLWSIRSRLAVAPPEDAELVGLDAKSTLDKNQEEILEKRRQYAFARGGTLPGRFMAYPIALRDHDRHLEDLAGVPWGVLRAGGSSRFLCSDHPAGELYIPVTPMAALVGGYGDGPLDDGNIDRLNDESFASCSAFVFGNYEDVVAFQKRRVNG